MVLYIDLRLMFLTVSYLLIYFYFRHKRFLKRRHKKSIQPVETITSATQHNNVNLNIEDQEIIESMTDNSIKYKDQECEVNLFQSHDQFEKIFSCTIRLC